MKIEEELLEKVRSAAQPLLEELHLVLVDMVIKRRGADLAIEMLVDRPQGGINLDECAEFNHRLSFIIEEAQWIKDGFLLDVSSPGLDRPLKTPGDFSRAANRSVRFLLTEPLTGKWEYIGMVQSVDDETVTIIHESGVVTIPVKIISKAVLVIK